MATQAAASSAPSASASDPEHQAWLKAVRTYPVAIPHFEWTLEWMLCTPMPQHQFTQTPIVIEVKDRNTNADTLLYRGPNVVGGYPHPVTGEIVAEEVSGREGGWGTGGGWGKGLYLKRHTDWGPFLTRLSSVWKLTHVTFFFHRTHTHTPISRLTRRWCLS